MAKPKESAAEDWIDHLVQDLLDMDDRTSPEDMPDHLLVTAEELRALIQAHLGAGLMEVAAERLRQVEGEGWSAEHDRHHNKGELVRAAAAYVYAASIDTAVADRRLAVLRGDPGPRAAAVYGIIVRLWPWGWDWWKPRTPRRDLVRGLALGIAELDRQAMNEDQAG